MKITNVTALYPNYNPPLPAWRVHLWQIVVIIETDVGLTGHGFGGGGKASLPIINGHFRELLVGQSVDSVADIGRLWDMLYQASVPYGRRGIALMALSGVDLALWDVLGKAENMPVYQLIGKKEKDKVRAYATGNDTVWYAELGFTAHKFSHRWAGKAADIEPAIDRAIKQATLARELFGSEALMMVDCYMSWDATMTQKMANALAPYNFYWFEDVLHPDDLAGQAALRPAVKPILLAGGEHEFAHYGFTELARSGALDLWQPDVTWCGGITALLRIIELAQQVGIPVVPHRGGEVWGLHVIVASACDDLGEVLPGQRDSQRPPLWFDEPQAQNGFLTPLDAPGFGVTLNEDLFN